MDVLHKILEGFGISYVSIRSVCSEISAAQVKRFSFIVMGDELGQMQQLYQISSHLVDLMLRNSNLKFIT